MESKDQGRPSHLCETLELVNKKMYPHLYCILKMYPAMPPSTATAERSFSVLKRVKTRHSVTGKTIGLCIATYSQRQAVVDKFNNTRQRKLLLAWFCVNIHYIRILKVVLNRFSCCLYISNFSKFRYPYTLEGTPQKPPVCVLLIIPSYATGRGEHVYIY